MKNQILTLVGAGVNEGSSYLHKYLDDKWTVVNFYEEPEIAKETIAAITTPNAIHWKKEFPKLQFLQFPGSGVDGFNLEFLPNGCRVANVFEHEESITEFVFGSLYNWFNKNWLHFAIDEFLQGSWSFLDRIGKQPRHSLCGKNIGILGFGHIGKRITNMALVLDMNVNIYTINSKSPVNESFKQQGVQFLNSIHELAESVEIFIIACPLNAKTKGMVNKSVFAKMRSDCVLVNIARGPIVEEEDLFYALKEERISGAILDVWYQYPDSADDKIHGSKYPLHELKNIVMTPHLSAHTSNMVSRRWEFISNNLNRFLNNKKILNLLEY